MATLNRATGETDHPASSMQDNLKCAMVFLTLVIEQVRCYDPDQATVLRSAYYNPLSVAFDQAVTAADDLAKHADKSATFAALEKAGTHIYKNLMSGLPQTPPGLGHPSLTGGVPLAFEDSHVHPQRRFLLRNTGQGRLADHSSGGASATDDADGSSEPEDIAFPGLAALLGDSEPLEPHMLSKTLAAIERPKLGDSYRLHGNSDKDHTYLMRHGYVDPAHQVDQGPNQLPTQSNHSHGRVASAAHPAPAYQRVAGLVMPAAGKRAFDAARVRSPKPFHPRAPPSSWATIAANAAGKPDESARKPPQLIAAHAAGSGSSQAPLAPETSEEMRRVVWIHHLPRHFSLLEISRNIDQGPIMSILLNEESSGSSSSNTANTDTRSACIIFQHAAHAHAFYSNNSDDAPSTSSTSSQTMDIPPSSLPHKPFAASAPQATFHHGELFARDADLISMDAPDLARRRIKWSRARLFYDVTFAQFKADVRSVAGAHNIELLHFYNPGEATAVFASVRVAAAVRARFLAFARKPASPYRAVDVAFVHDFNEAPVRLVSQYGPDGRVRKISGGVPGKGGADAGVEGIFSGPVRGR